MTGIFTAQRSYDGIKMIMRARWAGKDHRLQSTIPKAILPGMKNLGRTLNYFLLDGCMEIRGELRD